MSETNPTPAQRPLEHYWVTAAAHFPDANAEGFRVFKGRQYVDVSGGGIVHVATDAETGLYRARLPSELTASGPVLLRDTDSGLWHPLEDFEPITFPLTDTRLGAFRTKLDFSDAEPGSDGLHRFDGKLYAVIENHAYEVLYDPDASTPLAAVMRIVRSEDPVADDNANIYVSTRPGRSEPIVFDAVQGWVGTGVAGAGGMMRGEGDGPVRQGLLDRLSSAFNRLRSPESRAGKLFPDHSKEQITVFIRSLGADVEGGLTRREAEYKTLKAELKSWVKQPSTASTPGTAKGWAQGIADEIKRCWRQQTGTTLRLEPGTGTLPALNADFSHVRRLELDSVTWSDTANTFLAGFSGLEHLTVTRSTLDKLPAAVAEMSNLRELDLSSNRIQLNEQTAGKLSALSKLKRIDLSENPLGKTPDFAGMSELEVLKLSNTQLDQWPTGLQNQTRLKLVDLRNNRLREVPPAILNPSAPQFEAIARINSVTLFEGNPFPAGYWKTLEVYWRRVTADRPELRTNALAGAFRLEGGMPEVASVQRVYPNKNAQEAREFFIGLGDDAEATLARRAQDLDVLETQLDAYIGASQPGSSTINTPAKIQAQRVARIIKGCWLQDSGEMLRLPSVNGSLPALTVDFSHVRLLSLDTITWSDAADTFLSNFPNLEHLSITHSRVEKVPAKIGEMDKLSYLGLSTNRIELDERSAAKLSAMSQLTTVNLAHNPLKTTPDFSAMSGLTTLALSNTGISQWPTGLQDKAALTSLDLRNNQLSEVPQAFLDPTPEQLPSIARINGATLLEGNEFPADYWRTFDGYWRRLNATHPELMSPAHPAAFDSDNSRAQRYRRIYPAKSIKECREYLWGLESGTVATKLNALEQEFNTLKSQLDNWAFSGGGAGRGYIRANQLQINAVTRNDRNTARDRILSCWRRETPQKLANDGTPIGLELDLSGLRLPNLPDLDVDFSHVGSLKLNNMNLSASPEGFLTRYRHVRWLDMSNNQLRELPPALGEMNGLTRLVLNNNEIRLTPETARDLSGRTTLRALLLHGNPELGITPDFSRITDMRSLYLSNTGIENFPTGLAEQPLLDVINLSNNRISTIPDSVIAPPDDRLALTSRANNVTNVSGNPLSNRTMTQLINYVARLIEAETPMTGPNNLFITSTRSLQNGAPRAPIAEERFARWIQGLSASEVSARRIQWNELRQQAGSDGLFSTLSRLLYDSNTHADLQRRVWAMIDTITENNADSHNLRRELFNRAGEAACCDRAAFTFSNLETRAMMHSARSRVKDQTEGLQLSTFSRGLFRLHTVDEIASADIAQSEAIVNDPKIPEAEKRHHRNRLAEEVEIRLAYRFKLKDRLQLPGQPEKAAFIGMANVSNAMLEAAYKKVVALDNSPEEFQALASREFWQEYLANKYQLRFEEHRQPFQDRMATLDAALEARQLSGQAHEAQAIDVQAELAKAETVLIETLTRQELNEHPLVDVPLAGPSGAPRTQ